MITFESDYSEGAHEAILQRLLETNMEQAGGYGEDQFTESAIQKIKDAVGAKDAQVFLLSGGTQTNQIVIDSLLHSYEGVVAAETGHVNVHEAGAIEFGGHKVLALPSHEGKIEASELRTLLETFFADANYEHMVFPGMVYISFPTEFGTLYSRSELSEIAAICRGYSLPLFVDGARLGYGLMSPECEVDLPFLAKCADVFYIGGTKVGALLGEAVVFTKHNMPKHFLTIVKQHGALLAKGRLLGIQFDTLFTDDLYFRISKHALEMSDILRQVIRDAGIPFYLESPTNQQFVIMKNEDIQELRKSFGISFWEKYDDEHTIMRFSTSWATKEEDIRALGEKLKEIIG